MSLLVRKINRAKWEPLPKYLKLLQADAMTGCLRTTSNRLSFWVIEEVEELWKAGLAIVTAHDHLETFDVVVVQRSRLESKGLVCEPSEGRTYFELMRHAHVDLVDLNMTKLTAVAREVVEALCPATSRRFTISDLKHLLLGQIKEGHVPPDKLSLDVQKKLGILDMNETYVTCPRCHCLARRQDILS